MFVPKLYIGIGEFNHFFTLRESYQHHFVRDGINRVEVRAAHLFNLSQNADVALEKAKEYAEKVGLQLVASKESLEHEMREIKRASQQELEERAAREAQMIAEAEERRKAHEALQLQKAMAGIIPFGRHKDRSISELRDEEEGFGYLIWIANSDIENPLFNALRAKILEIVPKAFLPKPDPVKKFGEAGQKVELNVAVVKEAYFRGNWGLVFIISMVAEDGSMLISKGAKFAGVGARLRIKGSIKGHAEYNGQMQSIIQRVKVLECH